jgi:hypothetical protein
MPAENARGEMARTRLATGHWMLFAGVRVVWWHSDGGTAIASRIGHAPPTVHQRVLDWLRHHLGCIWESFTIPPVGGQPLAWGSPCIGCMDAACGYRPLDPDSPTIVWDGTYYEYQNCAFGMPLHSCVVIEHCAPPGKYVARWPRARPGTCGTNPPADWVMHEETFDQRYRGIDWPPPTGDAYCAAPTETRSA